MTTYEDADSFLYAFVAGVYPLLFFLSEPGMGKSWRVRAALKGLGGVVINAQDMSGKGLYVQLYRARGHLIVFDDVGALMRVQKCRDLLRELTNDIPVRTLSWGMDGLSDDTDPPSYFETTSKVLILCNSLEAADADIAAILDRATVVRWAMSPEQVHDEAAKWWVDTRTQLIVDADTERRCRSEIYSFVGKHLPVIPSLTFRDYQDALRDMLTKGQDWEQNMLDNWGGDDELCALIQVARDPTLTTQTARAEAWQQLTGGSYRDFRRICEARPDILSLRRWRDRRR